MDDNKYILYGSDISYYTGKTRSNLLHKHIPFVEQTPNPWQYLVMFPRRVGAAARQELIEPRPHLAGWLQRMNDPASSEGGQFWSEDSLPGSLSIALHSIFDQMAPLIRACRDAVCAAPSGDPERFLETITYPMAGGLHTRGQVAISSGWRNV